MFSRDEAKKLKESFWTTFGQYMRPVPFAEEGRQQWVNYKTGIRHLYFRMEAGPKGGRIGIEIAHPDESIRALMFEQFTQLRTVLRSELDEEWLWEPIYTTSDGKIVSTIYISIEGINVFQQEDWPKFISFFKPRIIALDSFWSMGKYSFDLFK